MNRSQYIEHFIGRLNEKDFTILTVRKELQQKGLEEPEIKAIVRAVDEEMQRQLTEQPTDKQVKMLVYVGAVLIVIGIGVYLLSSVGIIDTGQSYVVTYGPIFVGMAMCIGGMRRLKKAAKPDPEKPNMFRRHLK